MLEDYTPSSKNGSFPWSMLVWGVVTWFSRSRCGLTRLTKVLRISAQTIYSSTHYTHSYATAVDLSLSPCCGFWNIVKSWSPPSKPLQPKSPRVWVRASCVDLRPTMRFSSAARASPHTLTERRRCNVAGENKWGNEQALQYLQYTVHWSTTCDCITTQLSGATPLHK